MDDILLDIQENIIITITTPTRITKEPSRAARVPTTSIWILTLRTMLDPLRLLGRSARGRAVRSRMKARAQVGSSPGAEATTANFDSVRGAPQKHLFPLTIKLPIIAIYQTLSLLVTLFWIDINVVSYFFFHFSLLFFIFFCSDSWPVSLCLLVALAIVLRNQV